MKFLLVPATAIVGFAVTFSVLMGILMLMGQCAKYTS